MKRCTRRTAVVGFLFVALLATGRFSGASAAPIKTVKLDADYEVVITTDDSLGTATVTLSQYGKLLDQLTVGNAAVESGDIRWAKLCKTCGRSLYIPLYDRSSTYGATTGVVVWGGGNWWLSILPLMVPQLAKTSTPGVFDVIETLPPGATSDKKPAPVHYTFDSGFLTRK